MTQVLCTGFGCTTCGRSWRVWTSMPPADRIAASKRMLERRLDSAIEEHLTAHDRAHDRGQITRLPFQTMPLESA